MKKIIVIAFFNFFMQAVDAQQIIPLYEGSVPNGKPYTTKEVWEPQTNGDTLVHFTSQPTLTVFLPPKSIANGTAVIICPGGGYWLTSIVKEGFAVARRLNEMGIAAFVLKYRMPNDSSMADKSIGPLQDAQRAIQIVRANAKQYNIDVNKVGIMGFSAGGHLASTAATHFQKNYIGNNNTTNLRPDFAILVYPVISFKSDIAHIGSRERLIGKNATDSLVNLYSNELQVTAQTPPAFLVHASDDNVVPVMNTVKFYEALHSYKIPVEMHIYKSGGHGFGLNNTTTKDDWLETCKNWMQSMGWLNR